MRCENCGFREFREELLPEGKLELCELCDHPHGDSALVASHLDRLRAKDANVDFAIWPLYKLLEGWPEVKVGKSSAGDPQLTIPPYIYFSLRRNTLKPLEKLSISLEMAARKMHSRWVIEAAYQRGLSFSLRPMFFAVDPHELPQVIELAQQDVPTLASTLERDMSLNWWSQS